MGGTSRCQELVLHLVVAYELTWLDVPVDDPKILADGLLLLASLLLWVIPCHRGLP